MPERISKTQHEYAGRGLSKGDHFEVEAQHVDLLLRLGRIEPEEGEFGFGVTEEVPSNTLHVVRRSKNVKRSAA